MHDDNSPDNTPGNLGRDNPDPIDSERDINLRGLAFIGAAILGVVVLTGVSLAVALNFFAPRSGADTRTTQVSPIQPTVPVQAIPTVIDPPEPRLQVNEPEDLATIRSMWRETLDNYGWVDEGSGVAHVPIERAKELYLQSRPASRQGAQGSLLSDDDLELGDSSSGRVIRDER